MTEYEDREWMLGARIPFRLDLREKAEEFFFPSQNLATVELGANLNWVVPAQEGSVNAAPPGRTAIGAKSQNKSE